MVQEYQVTRSVAKGWVQDGRVSINGETGKPASNVREGDVVKVHNSESDDSVALSGNLPSFEVVYEDDALMVINKPSGLTVHPGSGVRGPTLVAALRSHTDDLSEIGGADRPGIVHRLDRDTEGLMIIAKTNLAHENLKGQFQARTIVKKYLARVAGVISKDDVDIDLSIGRHRNQRTLMTTSPSAIVTPKPAKTIVKVLRRWTNQTLVEARPITGRTHQIRVHLAAIGHPVIGDVLYNKKNGQNTELCLQAVYLKFQHPLTGADLEFSLPATTRIVG